MKEEPEMNQTPADLPFVVEHANGDVYAFDNIRKITDHHLEGKDGSVMINVATGLLGVLAAGLFFVSFKGQFTYLFAARHQSVPSMIEAAMLDTGMIVFTLLALGLSRVGKSSRTERALILACSIGSAGMNYAAADDASPRSVIAYTAAPIFLAVVIDRVVAVVRRHVLSMDEASAWTAMGNVMMTAARLAGLLLLYGLRLCLAFRETAVGLRQAVLTAAPLPQPSVDDVTPTKKAVLLAAYRAAPEYGMRSAASQVAARLAPLADLQPGTARSYVYAELARLEGESA
jgi:Protein of unknown function (DUF2637)